MKKKLEMKLKDFIPIYGSFRFYDRFYDYEDEIGTANLTQGDMAKYFGMWFYHFLSGSAIIAPTGYYIGRFLG